eukprot:SAG25_NODE_134_length_14400_cov_805.311049_10_plen_192_part_00
MHHGQNCQVDNAWGGHAARTGADLEGAARRGQRLDLLDVALGIHPHLHTRQPGARLPLFRAARRRLLQGAQVHIGRGCGVNVGSVTLHVEQYRVGGEGLKALVLLVDELHLGAADAHSVGEQVALVEAHRLRLPPLPGDELSRVDDLLRGLGHRGGSFVRDPGRFGAPVHYGICVLHGIRPGAARDSSGIR